MSKDGSEYKIASLLFFRFRRTSSIIFFKIFFSSSGDSKPYKGKEKGEDLKVKSNNSQLLANIFLL